MRFIFSKTGEDQLDGNISKAETKQKYPNHVSDEVLELEQPCWGCGQAAGSPAILIDFS